MRLEVGRFVLMTNSGVAAFAAFCWTAVEVKFLTSFMFMSEMPAHYLFSYSLYA